MKHNPLRFIYLIIFFGAISACKLLSVTPTLNTPSTPVFSIFSLKENFPLLEAQAKLWHPDAYLTYADIPLHSRWDIVSAGFQSPSDTRHSLLVRMEQNGNIVTEIIEHKAQPVLQREPITTHDWVLDSQEALDILLRLDEESRQFLQRTTHHCSSLFLERVLREPGHPLVWRLALFDCQHFSRYIYLDPLSGELLFVIR